MRCSTVPLRGGLGSGLVRRSFFLFWGPDHAFLPTNSVFAAAFREWPGFSPTSSDFLSPETTGSRFPGMANLLSSVLQRRTDEVAVSIVQFQKGRPVKETLVLCTPTKGGTLQCPECPKL